MSKANTYINPETGAMVLGSGIKALNTIPKYRSTHVVATFSESTITHNKGDVVGGIRLIADGFYVIAGTSSVEVQLSNNSVNFGQAGEVFSGVFRLTGPLKLTIDNDDIGAEVSYILTRLFTNGSITTGIDYAINIDDSTSFDGIDFIPEEGVFVAASIMANADVAGSVYIKHDSTSVTIQNDEAKGATDIHRATIINTPGDISVHNGIDNLENGTIILIMKTDVNNETIIWNENHINDAKVKLDTGMYAVRLTVSNDHEAGGIATATYNGSDVLVVGEGVTNIAFFYSSGGHLEISTQNENCEWHIAKLS